MARTENNATESVPVIVARFSDEAVAQLAAGLLEGEGIEPFVWTRMPSRGLGQREASLSVRPGDAEKARAILGSSPARNSLVE
jgi:hypothetical protein